MRTEAHGTGTHEDPVTATHRPSIRSAALRKRLRLRPRVHHAGSSFALRDPLVRRCTCRPVGLVGYLVFDWRFGENNSWLPLVLGIGFAIVAVGWTISKRFRSCVVAVDRRPLGLDLLVTLTTIKA